MQKMALLVLLFMITVAAADVLQNPDFESLPLRLPANSTGPFAVLNNNSAIPGWSFEGTVQYVTAGPNISLPGKKHALRLCEDGKINQTFTTSGNGETMDYVMTFTLAPDGEDCLASARLIVSALDSKANFSLKQRYGKEAWESYGHYIGTSVGKAEPVNIVFQSEATDSDPNTTCWPIVDDILLKGIKPPAQNNDNLVVNGGFELGPQFLSNSSEGILLDPEPSPTTSAVEQWSVMGTVKYIDSKHYFVPEGKAAIEIVSGASGGIQTATTLLEGSHYSLEFMLGDANDSCEGEFLVGARAGSAVQNFSLKSNGTGSALKFSMPFKADSRSVLISFLSYRTSQTKDGRFCGPVVDSVLLRAAAAVASYGQKLDPHGVLACLSFLLVTLPMLIKESTA